MPVQFLHNAYELKKEWYLGVYEAGKVQILICEECSACNLFATTIAKQEISSLGYSSS